MTLRQVTYRVLGGGRRSGEGACRRRRTETGGYDKKEDNYYAKSPHISMTHAISVRAKATGSRNDNKIPAAGPQL